MWLDPNQSNALRCATANAKTLLRLGGMACLVAALTSLLPGMANDLELANKCNVDTPAPYQALAGETQDGSDCYEFGAAVGELGLNWRNKLPSRVRWLNRKDAASLCQQAETAFGQKVDSPLPGGCVFLAPDACTIVTDGPISPASIGNAVRYCAP